MLIITLALVGCSVEQTQEAALPDVDVEVEAGNLPKFDVKWADVDVGTRTKLVKVPKVVVVMDEVEVEIPYLDVNMPGRNSEERTLAVEVEVADEMHRLEVEEVHALGERLIVVSRLTPTGEALEPGQRVRVSDRIVVRAPEVDVSHFIVGVKPQGEWNKQYRFVANRAELDARLEGGRTLYQR